MIIFLILAILLGILLLTILIVYLAISKASRHNKQYEIFAKENNYQFDKAMGRISTQTNTKNTLNLGIEVFKNPLIEKYADFDSYPFNAGTNKVVSYVIEGVYKQQKFRTFNYQFVGSVLDGKGAGGNFSIVMIYCQDKFNSVVTDPNVFFEKNWLCYFEEGDLEINTIHSKIDKLNQILRGETEWWTHKNFQVNDF